MSYKLQKFISFYQTTIKLNEVFDEMYFVGLLKWLQKMKRFTTNSHKYILKGVILVKNSGVPEIKCGWIKIRVAVTHTN